MKVSSNNKTALITYVYPASISYFADLVQSIKNQTFKDFDFIVFSDQIRNEQFLQYHFKIQIIRTYGTPIQIRFKSIDYLKHTNYENLIFVDSDDTMSLNRMEILTTKLKMYSLVSNDINLMDNTGFVYKKNIWKKRLGENFEFNSKFLLDKNIVGFGCLAIKKNILKYTLKLNSSPIASDWFIFYQFLKQIPQKALFTSECQTNYRQHQNNEAGIKQIDVQRLEHIINVKRRHYESLFKIGFQEVIEYLQKLDEIDLEKINRKNTIIINSPFWWEESNFIN